MTVRTLIAAALLSVFCNAGSEAKEIPGTRFKVAGWDLSGYTSDSTGNFSHCALSASYRSGISMFFAVSHDFTWRVGWSHPNWTLTPGQSLTLQLYIDGAGPYSVTGVAKNKDLVLAELSSTAAIFDAFRKGYVLNVHALGNKYAFNLDGTYAALTEALTCAKRIGAGGTYAYQPAPPPPPAPPAPMIPPTAVAPTTAPAVTADQRIEATALVANILGQGELSSFRILTTKNLKEAGFSDADATSWHVVWKAEDIIGTLRIIPKGVFPDASAMTPTLLSSDAKSCKGSFASGTTPDEKSPNVLRVFTACKDPAGSFEYRYTIVPIEDGAFYLFGTIGKSKAGERSVAIEKVDVLLRNAVYEVLKK